jgi:hypothetical protein
MAQGDMSELSSDQIAEALQILQQHSQGLLKEQYQGQGSGFDIAQFIGLTNEDRWQPEPGYTRMMRTVPKHGTHDMWQNRRPYKHQEFPKMLYAMDGDKLITQIVNSKKEQDALQVQEEGWYDHPDKAKGGSEAPEAMALPRRRGRPPLVRT